MKYEQLCKRLSRGSEKGYASADSITGVGGYGWGSSAYVVFGEGIKKRYFDTHKSSCEVLGKLEDRINCLELKDRYMEDYFGNLIGVEEWREDDSNGLLVRWRKGYLFPNREGMPKADDYYRGFGKPEVYGKEEKDQVIELERKISLIEKKHSYALVGCMGASFSAMPFIGIVGMTNMLGLLAIPISCTALTLSYMYKLLFDKWKKEDQLRKIPQKFKEEETIEQLCKLYGVK